MNLIIKGFIIGMGKIIPGVSGSMLAITLGIYEKILSAISNIKKEFKQNAPFLMKTGTGIILAIILTSKIIVKCLNNYYLPTMLLFIGMIIGGTPQLIKEIKPPKKSTIIILTLTIILAITLAPHNTIANNHILEYNLSEFIKLIGIGIIDSASSIIPGISGTAILMMLGYYDTILNTFGNLMNINYLKKNLFIMIPFIIGFIIGTIIISKIITILFKKYKQSTYLVILIFTLTTTIILLKNTITISHNPLQIILALPLSIIGYYISIKLDNLE